LQQFTRLPSVKTAYRFALFSPSRSFSLFSLPHVFLPLEIARYFTYKQYVRVSGALRIFYINSQFHSRLNQMAFSFFTTTFSQQFFHSSQLNQKQPYPHHSRTRNERKEVGPSRSRRRMYYRPRIDLVHDSAYKFRPNIHTSAPAASIQPAAATIHWTSSTYIQFNHQKRVQQLFFSETAAASEKP
jgi:hypothetical protein